MAIFVLTLLRVAINKIPPDLFTRLVFHPLIWILLIVTFGICASCLWFVARINQRAVRKQIEPRLTELEKLRADLLLAK